MKNQPSLTKHTHPTVRGTRPERNLRKSKTQVQKWRKKIVVEREVNVVEKIKCAERTASTKHSASVVLMVATMLWLFIAD